MFHRTLRAAALACALIAAPLAALAGPISGYPAATTPLSGSETMIGTQGGSTVQITAASVAAIVTAATNSWTGVQTFPAPGASHGSIVLTPGTVSGTPPNGSLWTTSSGVFAEIGGSAQQFITSGPNSWTGKQTFSASTASAAGVNLGQGTGPTSPLNGDLWITSSGVFARVGGATAALGVTVPTATAGGSNTQLQYNCSSVLCGAGGFGYASAGQTLTAPDGTTWSNTGVHVGASSALDLNGTILVSGTQPMLWGPNCPGGGGAASWLLGPSHYCTHATSAATDNICIGTDTCGENTSSLTTAFANTTAGSENMKDLTTGSNNTSFGFESLHDVTTGSGNVALGSGALDGVTTGNFNIGIGPGAGFGIDTGSSNLCIVTCGTLETGNHNTLIQGGGTLASGSDNLLIGASTGDAGHGIVAGTGNVWIGGQSGSIADQNDSVTLADADASGTSHVLLQYTVSSGLLSIKQPVRSTGSFIGEAATTVAGLASADPSPTAGDRGFVTDATACTFGSTVSGSGSTKCPVYYDGAAWKAG